MATPSIFPSRVRFVDDDGLLTAEAVRALTSLTQGAHSPIFTVSATGSPFTYVAIQAGELWIKGGTVSSITLTRGAVSITTGATSGGVSVSAGDSVTVTYTVLPTIYFVPR